MNVTVCIPTYNGARHIAETVQSVLAQTMRDFECIVMDDASDDDTLEVVAGFNDSRIRIVCNRERAGACANRNRCFALAGGDYICMLDQDDVMLPENLEAKVRVLDADPAVSFVHSAIEVLVEPPATDAPPALTGPADYVADGRAYFRKLLLEGNHVCLSAVLARRDALAGVGGFDADLRYSGDYAVWMKLCVNRRVGFLARPLLKYRWHGSNVSRTFTADHKQDQIHLAARRAVEFYLANGGPDGECLEHALESVSRANRIAARLDEGRVWLAEQCRRLEEEGTEGRVYLEQQVANWKREAEARGENIDHLQQYVRELHKDKAAREEQITSQGEALATQSARLTALAEEGAALRAYTARLEESLRAYESSRWFRLGNRLKSLARRRRAA
jgi:glycosyltransferase involved in cell wall biosynthesis